MKLKALQMIVRIIGLVELLLGIAFWTGNATELVNYHIALGSLLTVALMIITFRAYGAGVSKGIVAGAAVWILGLPIYGMTQANLLPGSFHVIAEVLHLVCGVGAIGVGEVLSAKINKKE